jgi:hypothetical protein
MTRRIAAHRTTTVTATGEPANQQVSDRAARLVT